MHATVISLRAADFDPHHFADCDNGRMDLVDEDNRDSLRHKTEVSDLAQPQAGSRLST